MGETMMTIHHKLPKRHRFDRDRFFNERNKSNRILVSDKDHQAWNTLTNSSAMTLHEIADSLSRFIPDSHKFVVVKRSEYAKTQMEKTEE
jgi:macrodomain Ter protein organizer (MatP/YcbG family)